MRSCREIACHSVQPNGMCIAHSAPLGGAAELCKPGVRVPRSTGGGDDVATGCPSWQEEACGLSADQVLDATLAWEGVAGPPVNCGTPCAKTSPLRLLRPTVSCAYAL